MSEGRNLPRIPISLWPQLIVALVIAVVTAPFDRDDEPETQP
jgi:hypothetical protein